MKKKLVSALVIACMAAMSVGSVSAMADTVKIGVYEPASGDNGAGGKQETLGMLYANTLSPKVEIGGTEYDVELDIVDIDEIDMVNIQAVHTLIHAFDSAFCRVVPNVHAVLAIAADFR